jgi:hypothetical protein
MAKRTRLDFSWSDEKHYRMAQGLNRFMDVMDRVEERERRRNEKAWQKLERKEARRYERETNREFRKDKI